MKHKAKKVPLRMKMIHSLMALGRIAPKPVGIIAHRIFISPLGQRRASSAEVFGSADPMLIQFERFAIRGYSWGKGPVALLLHGWQSRAHDMRHFVEPLLAAGYRVVAFDGLAHGTSDGRTASFDSSCRVTQQIVEEIAPHAIIGHSYGAATSVYALAKSRKADVKKLVLIAPIAETTQVVDNFIRVAAVPDRVRPHFDARLAHVWGNPKEYYSMSTLAKDVHVPTLMFHDRQDLIVPYVGASQVAANLPEVEFITSKGLGHYGVLKDTATMTAIDRFLELTPGQAVSPSEAAGGSSSKL